MSMLSQEEIDKLVKNLATDGSSAQVQTATTDPRKVKPFDFRFNRKTDKFSNNQLATLRTLHDNFARLLNNALSVYLRTRVDASVISIEQFTYGDFTASVGDNSILSIFSMDPLPGSGIVQLDLNLGFSIIDRLLGGPGWFPVKLRDLTEIERTLTQRFMARMLNSYRESWNYLLTLSLKIEALDSNPQFIPRIIPLDQMVAFVTCELKIGDKTGTMNFCLPYAVLHSISGQMTDFQWSPSIINGRGTTEDDVLQLAKNVERAEINFSVELARTVVSLRDLIALQPGDLLLFDKLVSLPLSARVNDQEKFKVFAGTNRDKLTVAIVDTVKGEE